MAANKPRIRIPARNPPYTQLSMSLCILKKVG
jgi:hypothetical protein